MIDSHAHLDFKEFDKDREKIIERFFDAGGEKIINVGCDLSSSERSVELASKHKNIFASIGIHPHDAKTLDETAIRKMEELVADKKVVAVGEIGLDYFRNLSPKEKQIEAFKAQLEFASKHKKPIIIHCRDAYNDLVDMLKNYNLSYNRSANRDPLFVSQSRERVSVSKDQWRGVVHCFLGSRLIAEELLRMGFYLGFTGAITYAKKVKIIDEFTSLKSDSGKPLAASAVEPEIFKVIKNAPLERILVETDCPYLSPAPHRGERNEPNFVKHVIEKIAEIKKISAKEVEKATSENAKELFGI